MSIVLEDGSVNTLIDGHYVDLYAGQPRAPLAAPLQSVQFHAAAPALLFDIDPTQLYTLVVRGPGGLRLIAAPA